MNIKLICLFILIILRYVFGKKNKFNVNSIDVSLLEPVYKYDGSDDIEIDSKYNVLNYKISEGYFIVSNGKREYNFMDTNNKLLLNDFCIRAYDFSDGLAPITEKVDYENVKRYYINNKGEIVIDKVEGLELTSIDSFVNGVADVYLEENLPEIRGVVGIDTNGKIVDKSITELENVYADVRRKSVYKKRKILNKLNIVYEKGKVLNRDNLVKVCAMLHNYSNKGNIIFYRVGYEIGLYDKNKDEIITNPLYAWPCMQPFVNGKTYVFKEKNNNFELILIDETGKELKKINKYGKLQKKGNPVGMNLSSGAFNVSYIKNDKIVVNFNKVSVVLDMDGNEVLKSKYKNLLEVEENGMIRFYDEKTEKYGLINLNDELILKGYDRISNVYNNVVLLTKDGKTVIHKLKN